jgi:DNA-binding transcriptional LysR family regulator
MSDLRNLTFEHLLNYIAVVETGSFTRAAERRGVGKTTVSDSLQRLELELGATLLVRPTRRISVTEAGASFFETSREIVSGDRAIDLIAEGVDVAIRLGELADSSHRAVRIGEYSKWLVAGPDFVVRNALPEDIGDASNLAFVGLSVLAQPSRFELCRAAGDSHEIEFVTGLFADTVYACRAAVAEGAGIGLLPDFSVRADIAAGRLVRVYADWSTAPMTIHALLPPGRHTAPKVRALIDMLKEHSRVASR